MQLSQIIAAAKSAFSNLDGGSTPSPYNPDGTLRQNARVVQFPSGKIVEYQFPNGVPKFWRPPVKGAVVLGVDDVPQVNTGERPTSWPLDMPLFSWTGSGEDETSLCRLGHVYEGVLITGATGSGKSSTSVKKIAKSLLRIGAGGLVLCVKDTDATDFIEWATEEGREKDIIRFAVDGPYGFNPIAYESARSGKPLTINLVSLFYTIVHSLDKKKDNSSGKDEFWENAAKQLLTNCIFPLSLIGEVTTTNIKRMIDSAPTRQEQALDADFKRKSYCLQVLGQASDALLNDPTLQTQYQEDIGNALSYFYLAENGEKSQFAALAENTRSSVVLSLTVFLNNLNTYPLNALFGRQSTVTPDDVLRGKIVVVDVSIKKYMELGVIANSLWKLCFQRAIEARQQERRAVDAVPTFIFADEAQLLTLDTDALFQSTARSSKCSVIAATQNVPAYAAAVGGENAAEGLFGNFQVKIFHQNSEPKTVEWLQKMIGQSLQTIESHGGSLNLGALAGVADNALSPLGMVGSSTNANKVDRFQIWADDFNRLRKGGPENDCAVDAILFHSGRTLPSGTYWMKITYDQRTLESVRTPQLEKASE